MYKLLADSDALIKASKADFLGTLADSFEIVITADVYRETVIEGKKGMHKDAEVIEYLVEGDKIKVLQKEKYAKKAGPGHSFGKGESSVFQACGKNMVVVTDDLRFANYLEKEGIKNVSSTNILITLAKKKKISKEKALDCLEAMKPLIRVGVYGLAKKELTGEVK